MASSCEDSEEEIFFGPVISQREQKKIEKLKGRRTLLLDPSHMRRLVTHRNKTPVDLFVCNKITDEPLKSDEGFHMVDSDYVCATNSCHEDSPARLPRESLLAVQLLLDDLPMKSGAKTNNTCIASDSNVLDDRKINYGDMSCSVCVPDNVAVTRCHSSPHSESASLTMDEPVVGVCEVEHDVEAVLLSNEKRGAENPVVSTEQEVDDACLEAITQMENLSLQESTSDEQECAAREHSVSYYTCQYSDISAASGADVPCSEYETNNCYISNANANTLPFLNRINDIGVSETSSLSSFLGQTQTVQVTPPNAMSSIHNHLSKLLSLSNLKAEEIVTPPDIKRPHSIEIVDGIHHYMFDHADDNNYFCLSPKCYSKNVKRPSLDYLVHAAAYISKNEKLDNKAHEDKLERSSLELLADVALSKHQIDLEQDKHSEAGCVTPVKVHTLTNDARSPKRLHSPSSLSSDVREATIASPVGGKFLEFANRWKENNLGPGHKVVREVAYKSPAKEKFLELAHRWREEHLGSKEKDNSFGLPEDGAHIMRNITTEFSEVAVEEVKLQVVESAATEKEANSMAAAIEANEHDEYGADMHCRPRERYSSSLSLIDVTKPGFFGTFLTEESKADNVDAFGSVPLAEVFIAQASCDMNDECDRSSVNDSTASHNNELHFNDTIEHMEMLLAASKKYNEEQSKLPQAAHDTSSYENCVNNEVSSQIPHRQDIGACSAHRFLVPVEQNSNKHYAQENVKQSTKCFIADDNELDEGMFDCSIVSPRKRTVSSNISSVVFNPDMDSTHASSRVTTDHLLLLADTALTYASEDTRTGSSKCLVSPLPCFHNQKSTSDAHNFVEKIIYAEKTEVTEVDVHDERVVESDVVTLSVSSSPSRDDCSSLPLSSKQTPQKPPRKIYNENAGLRSIPVAIVSPSVNSTLQPTPVNLTRETDNLRSGYVADSSSRSAKLTRLNLSNSASKLKPVTSDSLMKRQAVLRSPLSTGKLSSKQIKSMRSPSHSHGVARKLASNASVRASAHTPRVPPLKLTTRPAEPVKLLSTRVAHAGLQTPLSKPLTKTATLPSFSRPVTLGSTVTTSVGHNTRVRQLIASGSPSAVSSRVRSPIARSLLANPPPPLLVTVKPRGSISQGIMLSLEDDDSVNRVFPEESKTSLFEAQLQRSQKDDGLLLVKCPDAVPESPSGPPSSPAKRKIFSPPPVFYDQAPSVVLESKENKRPVRPCCSKRSCHDDSHTDKPCVVRHWGRALVASNSGAQDASMMEVSVCERRSIVYTDPYTGLQR